MRNTLSQIWARFMSSDPRLFGGGQVSDKAYSLFRYEQLTILSRMTPVMMIACVCYAIVALVVVQQSDQRWFGIVWAFCLISLCSFFYLINRDPKISVLEVNGESQSSIRRVIMLALLIGVCWSLLPLGYYGSLDRTGQVVLTCLSIGILCSGALAFATLPSAAMVFIFPVVSAAILAITYTSSMSDHLLLILMIAYTATLVRAVVTFANQVLQKISEKIKAEDETKVDGLTGLLNRKGLEDYMATNAFEPLRSHGTGFAVLYLDLDHFKAINDSFGHDVGDELLREVAVRLRTALRPSDCVARVGGDEFCVVCRNIDKPAAAAKLALGIFHAFELPLRVSSRSIICRPSVGIALAPENGETAPDLIKNADVALYFCKQNHRGTYAFFTKNDDDREKRRVAIASALKGAIEQRQMHLQYQPIYSTRAQELTGFEALLRWSHPDLGTVNPDEFIRIAEEMDLIHGIGNFVLNEVSETMKRWPVHLRVAINFSCIQLRNPRIVETVMNTIGSHGLNPSQIEIELTESTSLEDNEAGILSLKLLREKGISIALDDFGTGHSSLAYLCALPIDRLKIDRSFIATAQERSESKAVIQGILALAKSLNISVVAEGIETPAQLLQVTKLGCDEMQGYLMSRPIDPSRLDDFIKSNRNFLAYEAV